MNKILSREIEILSNERIADKIQLDNLKETFAKDITTWGQEMFVEEEITKWKKVKIFFRNTITRLINVFK